MFGADLKAFWGGVGDEGTPGQVVGFSEEAGGALVDGGNGLFGEDRVAQAGDAQVMVEIGLHVLAFDALEMASGGDPGSQGEGSLPVELVEKVVLPGENDGPDGVGVAFELGEGMRSWGAYPQQSVSGGMMCTPEFGQSG
jgi:hypothetical protein